LSQPLAHTRVGAGDTIYLHGFLGSGRNLSTLARRLGGGVLVDLPGHGESPPLPPGADLAELARQVLDTVAEIGIPAARFVGHSLGGRVALRALLDRPAAVTGITLLDITPSPLDGHASEQVLEVLCAAPAQASSRDEMRRGLLAGGLEPALADWLLMNVTPGTPARWRFDREALAALHPRVNAEDLWPAVERRLAPLRCVRGARSPYVPDDDARRMESAGCPVETVNAGHYVHVEALDQVVALLAT
jgi:esterase